MGMDLNGVGGNIWWDSGSWARLLQVALDHGWEPAGTLPPDLAPEEASDEWKADNHESYPLVWDGRYGTDEEQTVTAEDAAHLADALELALPELDNEERFNCPTTQARLKRLIRICRAGAFIIG
jgi:hypothetical protein